MKTKISLYLISTILLITMLAGANATVTTTLVSPADGSTSSVNLIQFNSTGSTSTGYLVNASLYTNETGSWAVKNTSISNPNITLFSDSGAGSISWTTPTFYKTFNNSNIFYIGYVNTSLTPSDQGHQPNVIWQFEYTDGTKANVTTTIGSGFVTVIINATNPNQNKLVKNISTWTYMTSWSAGHNGGVGTMNIVGTNPIGLINNTYPAGSVISYNVQYCASDSTCSFAPANYTFSIDSSKPQFTLNAPISPVNYGKLGGNLILNFSATDTNLQYCWYNYNFTNSTAVACATGFNVVSNLTLTTQTNATLWANDTAGNVNSSLVNWNYNIFENSRTLNSTTYETSYESYSINVTANSSLTAVYLNYNGTELQTTYSGGLWTYSRDLPSTSVGNNSINYRFFYGNNNITTTNTNYQYVSPIQFGICNSTITQPYINFTFKDENSLANINGTIQTANFDYYLGQGSETKSLVYTNSNNYSNFTFCFLPGNKTLYLTPQITYYGNNYPTRFYEPGQLTLTNSTTNQTLYLLSSSDGIYVTFITTTNANTLISGATIEIMRTISGVNTIIARGLTDSAGSYTVWLNPNYEHTITATKTGFGTNTQVIRPTQSGYTLIIGSSGNYSYISNVRGLLWAFFPRGNITANSTNFGFNVSSVYANIIKCKVELLNNNKTIVLSTSETIASNSSFCSVQTTYTPNSNYSKMKGRLLVDIGDGYQILEEDAYWFFLPYTTTGATFSDWFSGMQKLDLSYFGNDEQHREYTYILFFFLFVTLVCAVLNTAGWDIQSNGGMIFVIGALVWVASVPGFLNLAEISPYSLINQYFVAIIYTMFMVGFGARSFS